MTDERMSENEVAREAAHREVLENLPALMRRKAKIRKAGMEPTSVVIPGRLNVPYDGDDATDFEGSCMNMPITWSVGEQWGFVVEIDMLDKLGVDVEWRPDRA